MEKAAMATFLLLLFSALIIHSNAEEDFDVRQHLATVTRYDVVKDIPDNAFVPSTIPDQCTPIHLNLVARHGTRAPTKKRIKELNGLAARFEVLLQDAKEKKLALEKVPAWFWEWKSPWKGKVKGGELIREGEDELYRLGIRIRDKFPQLFNEEYHPDVYPIKATQIPRASASAVAFGMGLFSGRGNIGPGHHRAFAVISESRASDIVLRFHDCCQNYKVYTHPNHHHPPPSTTTHSQPSAALSTKVQTLPPSLPLPLSIRPPAALLPLRLSPPKSSFSPSSQDCPNLSFLPHHATTHRNESLETRSENPCSLRRQAISHGTVVMAVTGGGGIVWLGFVEKCAFRKCEQPTPDKRKKPIMDAGAEPGLFPAFRKSQEPTVHKLKEPILDEITNALKRRYELDFTRQDTSSLWFLCKQEASLLNITNQACALFTPSEVVLLEWTDDLELFILKGYGNALNYRMGVPLLQDVVQSMEQAIKAKEEEAAPGAYEKARLRFAHAETLVPFSCLIGLFLEGSSHFEKIRKEEPLELSPNPQQRRKWRGSAVAPFGGNNMLDRIVDPHLKHNYNTICNPKLEHPEQMSLTSKLSRMFRWLFFSQRSDDTDYAQEL
ncbi:histidine acid phosphatase family protein [Actinidia rufa]|uniref:Multiple inositol polyphosphate phosphatase 1 n=1 Tax=Actinidia rufa TaxID=165716 RepID=A0A7J0GWF2_9ERIC|nr:histidine acid phosphatase family protein [Actinidia rufa]